VSETPGTYSKTVEQRYYDLLGHVIIADSHVTASLGHLATSSVAMTTAVATGPLIAYTSCGRRKVDRAIIRSTAQVGK